MTALLTDNLPLLAGAPNGIKKLRELILELALSGKLTESSSHLWPEIFLGDLGAWGSGGTPPKTHAAYYGGDIPWLVIGDLNDSLVTSAEKFITSSGLTNSSAKIVPTGTILIAMYGSIGKLGIAGMPCATNQAIAHCQPNEAVVRGSFLFLLLRSMREALLSQGQGLAQQNISQRILKSIAVNIPPIDEQIQIETKVSELMALCDRLEAKQANAENAHKQLVHTLLGSLTHASDAAVLAVGWQRLAKHFNTLFTTETSIDDLKQTLLQLAVMGKLVPQEPNDEPTSELLKRIHSEKHRLIAASKIRKQKELATEALPLPPYTVPTGWVWQTLDEIMHVTGGITLGRKLAGRKLVSKPYLRVANVQRGHLDMRQIKEVEVPEDDVDKYLLQHGDLLITEGGDWDKVGRTAIWSNELPQCLHQNHVFRARAMTAEWEPRWAEMYLNSASARDYFAGSSKQTTNLASINMTQLRSCALPIPPLAEQRRIVAKVDQLMALCDQLKTRLTEARQLKAQLASTLVEQAIA